MSTSEQLLFWQTVILFLTGVVVLWYTVETRKLRKDAARQNELIASQLGVMQQSLTVMQQSLQFELQKETRDSEPFFRSGVGRAFGWSEASWELHNEGGNISDLKIAADTALNPKLSFTNFLPKGGKTEVSFRTAPMGQIAKGDLPSEIPFEIHYKTALNAVGVQRLLFTRGGISRAETKK